MRISDWSSDVCSSDLGVDVVGVQILHFRLGDLADLGHGDLADLVAVRHLGALGHIGGLAQVPARRRRLGLEGERAIRVGGDDHRRRGAKSEEHTSELQSLMRISYAVFCLKKKNINDTNAKPTRTTTNAQ